MDPWMMLILQGIPPLGIGISNSLYNIKLAYSHKNNYHVCVCVRRLRL